MTKINYSINDIATLAGVAPSTVSRVINHQGRISTTTRQRVLAVIADLDYQINPIARSLRQQKSQTIAVLYATDTAATMQPLLAALIKQATANNRLVASCPIIHPDQLAAIIALITREAITNLIVYDYQPKWLGDLLVFAQNNTVIWIDGPQATSPNIINIRSNLSSTITQLTHRAYQHGLFPVLLLSAQVAHEQAAQITPAFVLANYASPPRILNITTNIHELQKQVRNIQIQVGKPLLLICQIPPAFMINYPHHIQWAYWTEFACHETATTIHLDYQMVAAQILQLINQPTNTTNVSQFTNLILDMHFDH